MLYIVFVYCKLNGKVLYIWEKKYAFWKYCKISNTQSKKQINLLYNIYDSEKRCVCIKMCICCFFFQTYSLEKLFLFVGF